MRNEMLSFFRGAGFHEEFCVLLTFFFLIREVKKKKMIAAWDTWVAFSIAC